MLEQNCRVEKFNGFRFYEKDILYDNYIFTNDIQLTIDVTYITPGFGIALMDNESYTIKEKDNVYLFKVGYKEASIYHATKTKQSLIKQITLNEATTIQEHMIFKMIKTGKKVSIYLNERKVFEEYIKKDLDKYNIGYYSNAGNIINDISIVANIPENWTVNMKNTHGGYVRFINDCFEIIDCKYNAEIEQSNIYLEAGTYYLKIKTEKMNDKNDIKYYIHKSDDNRYFDDEKNLLRPGDKFTLIEPTFVNLKIVGRNGKAGNIILSKYKDDTYISTTINSIDFPGSYIDVFLSDLKKLTWKGAVLRTPKNTIIQSKDLIYGLILDNKTAITPEETKIILGDKYFYDYEFNTNNYTFYIKENNEVIYSKKLNNLSNKITIFKNISAIITELILYKSNGEVINVNVQDENKQFINASINSPIIVVDEYNTPLDLSSSYRVCKYKDYQKFLFTNWEREYFKPTKKIHLEKKVLNQDDTIIILGIKKKYQFNLDDIYNVTEDNINSIDLMTQHYDVLSQKDIIYIDKIKNDIILNETILDKYQMIVIDYLKADSYCINYHYENHSYEVNISSIKDNNKILYDSNIISDSNKKVYQISDYKITDINGNINGYVVLRKGGM